MEATSRRTARNVMKKLIDARKFLRWGRSGRFSRRIRPSLVRWRSNSMMAVTVQINTSRINSPDQCIRHYIIGFSGFWRMEKKQQVPPLRYASVAMTLLFLIGKSEPKQRCHPDRSVAQRRDLLFYGPVPEMFFPLRRTRTP